MKIFIICSVRGANQDYQSMLEQYVSTLESGGHTVHLPHRDTDQSATGLKICKQNRDAIMGSDEVHVFYSGGSQGTHFDLGMAFALNRKVVVIVNEKYGEGKSYPRMIDEWQASGS